MPYSPSYLRVNLATGQAECARVPEDVAKLYVGGRALGARYLYDELAPGIDPLGDQNKLLLISGPLAGTGALALSRWMAVTKSPLTGTFARSLGGADFGAWLGFSDLAFILVEGCADNPVYLCIDGETCSVHDATSLWGENPSATQAKLAAKHGDTVRTACIGVAGEKLVRYAGIFSGTRCAGRGGTGAVMGAKKLKAIVIQRPRRTKRTLSQPDAFRKLVREQAEQFTGGRMYDQFRKLGTASNVASMNALGIFPVRNNRWGQLPSYENLGNDELLKASEGSSGCAACPVNCGIIRRAPEGPFAGAVTEGPEYESIWAFTGPVDCPDLGFAIAADALCDELGMDTISAGNTIGFAYEAFEKGLLTTADTDGLELRYGDPRPAMILLQKIADRQGIGDILAEGVMRAAARIGKGAEGLAMHVKGLETSAFDPRGTKSMGLNFATASMGAHHCFGMPRQEIMGGTIPRAVDRLTEEGKGDITKYNQDGRAALDSVLGCAFPNGFGWLPLDHVAKLLQAATGVPELGDEAHLLAAGERACNVERLFNIREGFGRKDDTLPKRIRTEPILKCAVEGQIVRKLDTLLDEYYEARGWNNEGVPAAEKLQQLGIARA